MKVSVAGTTLRIDPRKAIGKGGEADVYDAGGGKAIKLFKPADHPDYAGDVAAQRLAEERLCEHQTKLPAFPRHVPSRVVAPETLVESGGRIVGYTMHRVDRAEVLLRFSDRAFRAQGVATSSVVSMLRDLHATVSATHRAGIVIGDFNDLNILVVGSEAYLIDADSFQYGAYRCRVFTSRFIDPLLCDPNASSPVPVKPFTEASDWYTFTILAMQCLLFLGPYGGVYKPRDPAASIGPDARALRRISVFHPDVRYPKPALPLESLPEDLLHYFHVVFEKDRRGLFPVELLERLSWTSCRACGAEHARTECPACKTVARTAPVARATRGRVTATRIFSTRGTVLEAVVHGRSLLFLYHENGSFKREDGTVVFSGRVDPELRFWLALGKTYVARGREVVMFTSGKEPSRPAAEAFDMHSGPAFWIQNGQLQKDGVVAPEVVGDVLEGQTRFWVGPEFGLGFYRAGELSVAFVFDVKRRGINDRLRIPLSGQLVDATCIFGMDRAWLFIAAQEGAELVHRAFVVRPTGDIEATAEAKAGDGSWLSSLRGKAASGQWLFAVSDEGLVRLEVDAGRIVATSEFPDTEPFVTEGSRILAGADGIYVVERNEIQRLSIH